ncbi:hypothetical protein I4U23_021904 [Adineta vaga]|nr:hypothetical protein I4U23_021904 [Adineta vaga]
MTNRELANKNIAKKIKHVDHERFDSLDTCECLHSETSSLKPNSTALIDSKTLASIPSLDLPPWLSTLVGTSTDNNNNAMVATGIPHLLPPPVSCWVSPRGKKR